MERPPTADWAPLTEHNGGQRWRGDSAHAGVPPIDSAQRGRGAGHDGGARTICTVHTCTYVPMWSPAEHSPRAGPPTVT